MIVVSPVRILPEPTRWFAAPHVPRTATEKSVGTMDVEEPVACAEPGRIALQRASAKNRFVSLNAPIQNAEVMAAAASAEPVPRA